MAFITLRQANVVNSPNATIKNSPLTNAEVDNNFANINIEVSDLGNTVANLSTTTITNGNSNVNIATADGPIEISANFLPLTANVIDLGSPTKRFRDLYLTGDSLDLNGTKVSSDGSNLLVNGSVVISNTGNYIGTINVQEAILENSITTTKIAENAVITSKINNGAVTTEKINNGAVTTEKLSTTGVSAATYGNATLVPTFTVGVDGRITSAGNVEIAVSGGGGGSGLFNTAISGAQGYNITDSLANAYAAPSTAGKRYIIHSVHITNNSSILANVTGDFSGTTYSSITFADTVPVPVGSSVELLKKPKIMQPSDALRLQKEGDGNLVATITFEESDDTKFFGRGVDLVNGVEFYDLLIASANSVIESILLSNDDSGVLDVKANVVWTNASNVVLGVFAHEMIIPNDATVEILEQPKFIENGFKVRVLANQGNRLEAIIAGKTV